MKNWLVSIVLLLLFSACSVQSKMNRNFTGKDKSALDNYFGQEGQPVDLPSGKRALLYTKSVYLRSLPISKGVTTLDPMVSPAVEKKEKYLFFIDKDGAITGCKYEKEYNR